MCDGILLGDSGYRLETYMLTPFLNPATNGQRAYNHAHCKTRVAIEQTNGILKMRFPCLRDLRVHPEFAIKVTVVCAILHNIALLQSDGQWHEEVINNPPPPPPVPPQPAAAGAAGRRGAVARDLIVRNIFT